MGQRKIVVPALVKLLFFGLWESRTCLKSLPTFLGVDLHLDLKHQTDESICSPSSLRVRAEMTQECLFGRGFPFAALCSFSPTFAIAPLESRWRTEHWRKGGSKEEHWKQECFAARGISFLLLSVQDNDALCAGTGGGGRWTGHGSTQPTAAGTWGAALLPCLLPQPTTSLKEVQGEILHSCSEEKIPLKTSERWVMSEQVLLKRPVQLFL